MPCRLNRSHLGDKILFKGLQLASLSLDTSPGICDLKRHSPNTCFRKDNLPLP